MPTKKIDTHKIRLATDIPYVTPHKDPGSLAPRELVIYETKRQ